LWLRFRALVGPVRRLCAAGLRLSAARLFGAAATTVAPAGGAIPRRMSGIRIDGDRGRATARRARPRVSAGRWQLANREIEHIPSLRCALRPSGERAPLGAEARRADPSAGDDGQKYLTVLPFRDLPHQEFAEHGDAFRRAQFFGIDEVGFALGPLKFWQD